MFEATVAGLILGALGVSIGVLQAPLRKWVKVGLLAPILILGLLWGGNGLRSYAAGKGPPAGTVYLGEKGPGKEAKDVTLKLITQPPNMRKDDYTSGPDPYGRYEFYAPEGRYKFYVLPEDYVLVNPPEEWIIVPNKLAERLDLVVTRTPTPAPTKVLTPTHTSQEPVESSGFMVQAQRIDIARFDTPALSLKDRLVVSVLITNTNPYTSFLSMRTSNILARLKSGETVKGQYDPEATLFSKGALKGDMVQLKPDAPLYGQIVFDVPDLERLQGQLESLSIQWPTVERRSPIPFAARFQELLGLTDVKLSQKFTSGSGF